MALKSRKRPQADPVPPSPTVEDAEQDAAERKTPEAPVANLFE